MANLSLTRRGLFQGSASTALTAMILGAGVGLTACTARDGARKFADPYDVWRDIQTALRSSPDHGPGRAASLIAGGDIDAMHQFVRDEIRLTSFDPARLTLNNNSRFGLRACLRSGAGTARDKADLLAHLLTEAGYRADVVETAAPETTADAILFRNFEQPFAPNVSDRQLYGWSRGLGLNPQSDETGVILVGDEDRAETLKSRIEEALGDQMDRVCAARSDLRVWGRMPVVRITDDDGSVRYADVLRADGQILPEAEMGRISDAAPAEGMDPVRISLSARTLADPDESIELVSAEWSTDLVAGRQVRLGFRPQGETLEILMSPVADLRTFVPAISLQALDDLDGVDPSLNGQDGWVIGDGITLDGQHLTLNAEGKLYVDGVPGPDAKPSGLAGKVATLDVDVEAGTYPNIEVAVTPRDASGRIVKGLVQSDFLVADQGEGVASTLIRATPPPAILFLADSSLSMPKAFRGNGSSHGDHGEAMLALRDRVKAVAESIDPRASVHIRATRSNLWEEAERAARQNRMSLIVYATDGNVDGKQPDDAMRHLLRKGPPIVLLNVQDDMADIRTVDGQDNLFDRMALYSGGSAHSAIDGDFEHAAAVIEDYLRNRPGAPYILNYRAASGASASRVCTLSVGQTKVDAGYDVPADPGRGNALIGLDVTIEVGDHSVTRTLAGHDGTGEVSDAHIGAVHGALFGNHLIAFEGELPPLSVQLDEYLNVKLGLEPIERAIIESSGDDVTKMIEAAEAGVPLLPKELITMMGRTTPMSGADFSFCEGGLRGVLFSEFGEMDTDKVVRKVDILPTNVTRVMAFDQTVRREKSYEASIPRALAEAALFDTSTYSLLDGKALRPFGRWSSRELDLSDTARQRWDNYMVRASTLYRHPGGVMIGASDGSVEAFWSVNNHTGEIVGLLPDMSGGGSNVENIKRIMSSLERVIAQLNLLATATGTSSFGMAMVAVYGQNLARLYAAASIAITLMDAGNLSLTVRSWLTSFVCEIAKELGFGIFKKVGKTAEKIIDAILFADTAGASVGKGFLPSCPSPV